MKKLTSLFMLLLMSIMMFAAEVEVTKTVSELYPSDEKGTQKCTLFSDEVLTISVNCKSNGNNGKIYGEVNAENRDWRLYKSEDAVMTVDAGEATIKTVKLVFTTNNSSATLLNGDTKVSSDEVITVNASNIDFTVGSGTIRITSFTVVYETAGGDDPVLEPTAVSLSADDIVFPQANIYGKASVEDVAELVVTAKNVTDLGITVEIIEGDNVFGVDNTWLYANGTPDYNAARNLQVSYSATAVGTYTGKLKLTPVDNEEAAIEVNLSVEVVSQKPDYEAASISVDYAELFKDIEYTLSSADGYVADVDVNVTGTNIEETIGITTTIKYAGDYGEDFVVTATPSDLPANGGKLNVQFKATAVGEYIATIDLEGLNATEDDEVVTSQIVLGPIHIVDPLAVTGVSLDVTELTLKVGKSRQLVATVAPENAANKGIEWFSNDAEVAEVVEGYVTAKKEGTTIISVVTVDGEFKADCEVTVVAADAASFDEQHNSTLNGTDITLSDYKGTSSENASDAKVVIDGTQYDALKFGTGQKKGIWKVNVPANTEKMYLHAAAWTKTNLTMAVSTSVDGVDIAPASFDVAANTGVSGNSPFTLQGDVTGENNFFELTLSGVTAQTELVFTPSANRFVVWGVHFVTSGETPIDEPIAVTGISLSDETLSLEVGKTATLVATVEPANATDKTVVWSSDNDEVATVTNGVVTAVAEGTATITVKTTDGEFSAECVVDVKAAEEPTINEEHTTTIDGDAANLADLISDNSANASAAGVVIDGYEYEAYKFGTTKNKGILNLIIPANTVKVTLHAAAWNGKDITMEVTTESTDIEINNSSLSVAANAGVAKNSPFTLEGDVTGENNFFELTLSGISIPEAELVFTPSANRFVVWGVHIETESSVPTALENVTIELDVNAPMFNVLGQRVDESYKGVVIQNGQKFLRK